MEHNYSRSDGGSPWQRQRRRILLDRVHPSPSLSLSLSLSLRSANESATGNSSSPLPPSPSRRRTFVRRLALDLPVQLAGLLERRERGQRRPPLILPTGGDEDLLLARLQFKVRLPVEVGGHHLPVPVLRTGRYEHDVGRNHISPLGSNSEGKSCE